MHKYSIYILSGPVHSGKTTALLNWREVTSDIYGIFTPVINNKRVFMDASTKDIFEMETTDSTDSILIGKYMFSKKGFSKAIDILSTASKNNTGWLVIDEVGPLELKKQGFYTILQEIISKEYNVLKLMLVVRETLVEDVIRFFNFTKTNYKIISSTDDLFFK